MATLTLARYVIDCDGCHTVFGRRDGFESQMEARTAAYAEGWRFPHRITIKGGAANSSSDVCPKCAPGWEIQPAYGGAGRPRILTNAERELLPRPG